MTGLVLEGGGMRGLFSAGVLDVFMESGVRFDLLVGVSAGAAFGCNFKSRQIGRAIRYNVKYCNDARYCSWRAFLRTGDIFPNDFCYRRIPEELDPFDGAAFAADPLRFYVVATDVKTGQAVYRQCERATPDTYQWIRASASMPGVSNAVQIGDGLYLDGGLSDSIPLGFAESKGCQKSVVILTRPRSYRKKDTLLSLLFARCPWKYPSIASALKARARNYNAQLDMIAEREAAGRVFVFAPPSDLVVGRIDHNPLRLREAYEFGRREALRRLSALREFLSPLKGGGL